MGLQNIGDGFLIQGTAQQEAIWDEMQNGSGDIMVDAGAGTGKTFTIVEGANRMSGNMAFFAFNKSIATELGKRLPDNVYTATFHSMGNSAIRENLGYRKMDKWKSSNIIREVIGENYYALPLVKLISLMKGGIVEATDRKSIKRLIDVHHIQFNTDSDEVMALKNLPMIMQKIKSSNVIDFDDMIWLPITLNLPLKKYDVVFVDEAQDFNQVQRMLILKCLDENARCVIVGDPNQAIYGFRGADSSSMSLFENSLKQLGRTVSKYPLSLTWRCPTSVVEEANRFVVDFHAVEGAKKGNVMTHADFEPVKGDMVLCRYNAPLVGAFYRLIGKGKSAYILGRDLGKGLVQSVKKITKDMNMTTQMFAEKLDEEYERQRNKLMEQEKLAQLNTLEDRHECICLFVYRTNTVRELIAEIERVFPYKDGKGDIMLSTVHKAKGLEADNVYILATERMPHPRAINMREEMNICYVAITRAKKNLYYVGPKPAEGVVQNG